MKFPKISFWTFVTFFALFILILFVLYPLISLLKLSFISSTAEKVTLEGYYTFFKDKLYRSALINSLFLSSLVTIGCLLIGSTMAFFVTRFDFPLKSLVKSLPLLTLILPSIIVAVSWILVLGRNGLITVFMRRFGVEMPTIYGWNGLAIVLIFQHYVYVFLMVTSVLSSVDASLEEAARNLGSSPLRTYLTVTFPVIAPSILASGLVVFTLAIENFGVPIILAERVPILSVVAYSEFIAEMGRSPLMSSTLSTMLLLVTTIALIIQKRIVESKVYQMQSRRTPGVKTLRFLPRTLIMIFCFGIIILSLFPIIICLLGSFTKCIGPVMYFGKFSIMNYVKAFNMAPRSIYNSFFLASVATLVGFFFATFVSYILVIKRSKVSYFLDILVMFPLAVAGTVLGIAFINTFNTGFLVLTGSWVIMCLAYFVRKVPFSIKASSSILYNIKASLEEASINLGVSPFKTFFKIMIPLMLPGIIAGSIIMWVTTIAELSATIVLYFGAWSTMPIQIFQQIDSGSFGTAAAYGSILIACVFIPLFVSIRFFKIDIFATK